MDRNRREFDDIEQGKDAAESAFTKSGHPDDVEDNRNRKEEKKLDHGLKETFPASDPVSINPGAD
jgi:hypothetical protein